MMKLIIALTLLVSSSFASDKIGEGQINMTCGKVLKARSGKLLRRLEPGFFGLNPKYVLFTKFEDAIGYNELHSKETYTSNSYTATDINKAYTGFSYKNKFIVLKNNLRSALKSAKNNNTDLYACVGSITALFKYMGTEVFYSTESLEAAQEKMRGQLRRHL